MFENLSYLGLPFTVIAAVWSLAWWLSGQFTGIRKLVYETSEKVLTKLEYHERHDDTRFAQVQEALTDIRVRNAASDAMAILREEKAEKNR